MDITTVQIDDICLYIWEKQEINMMKMNRDQAAQGLLTIVLFVEIFVNVKSFSV